MNQRRIYLAIGVLLAVSLLFSGCQKPTAGVSGTVTYNGKPLESFGISFEEISTSGLGRIAVGITDSQGHYTLNIPKGKDCPTGPCKVRLSWHNPKGKSDDSSGTYVKPPLILPENTTDGSIIFEVPITGTTEANFDFKAK